MEIGTKATELGRRRNFVVAKFDLGGGDTKVSTINIMIVKLPTTEPLHPDTDGDGGYMSAAATTTTTGDTTITYPVSVQVLEAPELDHLNDESFRVVVAQLTAETPDRPLSQFK